MSSINLIAIISIAGISLGSRILEAKVPFWYANGKPVQKIGSSLKVSCSGDGSSLDLARKLALKSCISIAADQLTTAYQVQTTTIQTETEAALHEEVSSNQIFSGLICNPQKETNEEIEGAAKVWIQCAFDLNMAKVGKEESLTDTNQSVKTEPLVIKEDEHKVKTPAKFELGAYSISDRRILNLSVMPSCDTVLVEGKIPRIMKCSSNPFAVAVSPGDTKIIIRAKGFKSKTFLLNSLRTPANAEENYEVILDR